MNTGIKFDELEDILVEDEVTSGMKSQLIVYNDDYNTFDWVIQCLMEVCNHTQEQSEQLSILVHFKGKATVKTGTMRCLDRTWTFCGDRVIGRRLIKII